MAADSLANGSALSHTPEHEPSWKLLGFSVHYAQEPQLNLTRAGVG